MSLDEISQNVISQMVTSGALPFHQCTPEQARSMYDSQSTTVEDVSDVKAIHKKDIPVTGGQIDIIIVEPFGNPVSVIVFYHGGGWVVGQASVYISFAKYLAKATQSIVVIVNYRKAPEFPYPVPANDAYEALVWIDRNMESIAGKRLPLIICGESAGGNLAAVTALKAKDLRGPEIACQILACPITGDNFENESYTAHGNQLIISKEDMIWFWDHYAPDLSLRKEPYVSPIYAKDLSGLPKTVLITAGYDPLRQEGEDYAARLIKAGVPLTFKRFEDQMHGFFTWVDFSPVSREAQNMIADVILSEIVPNYKY